VVHTHLIASIEVEDDRIVDATIAGTRLSVFQIAEYYYYIGKSIEYIADAFNLTQAQIFVALAYYHENKDIFDKAIIAFHSDEEGFLDSLAEKQKKQPGT